MGDRRHNTVLETGDFQNVTITSTTSLLECRELVRDSRFVEDAVRSRGKASTGSMLYWSIRLLECRDTGLLRIEVRHISVRKKVRGKAPGCVETLSATVFHLGTQVDGGGMCITAVCALDSAVVIALAGSCRAASTMMLWSDGKHSSLLDAHLSAEGQHHGSASADHIDFMASVSYANESGGSTSSHAFVWVMLRSGCSALMKLYWSVDLPRSETCGDSGGITGPHIVVSVAALKPLGSVDPSCLSPSTCNGRRFLDGVLRSVSGGGSACHGGFVGYALSSSGGEVVRVVFPATFDRVVSTPLLMCRVAKSAFASVSSARLLLWESLESGFWCIAVCLPEKVVIIADAPKVVVTPPHDQHGCGDGEKRWSPIPSPARHTPPRCDELPLSEAAGTPSRRKNPAEHLLPPLPSSSLFRRYPAFAAATRKICGDDKIESHDASLQMPSFAEEQQSPTPQPQLPLSTCVTPRAARTACHPSSRFHHRPLLDDGHEFDVGVPTEFPGDTSIVFPSYTVSILRQSARTSSAEGAPRILSARVADGRLWVVVGCESRAARSVSTLCVVDGDSAALIASVPLPSSCSAATTIISGSPSRRELLWSAAQRDFSVHVWSRPLVEQMAGMRQEAATAPGVFSTPSHPVEDNVEGRDDESLGASLTARCASSSPQGSPLRVCFPQSGSPCRSDGGSSLDGSSNFSSEALQLEELVGELIFVVASLNATPIPQRDPADVLEARKSARLAFLVRRGAGAVASVSWALSSAATYRQRCFIRWMLWAGRRKARRCYHEDAAAAAAKLRQRLAKANQQERFRLWHQFSRKHAARKRALKQCEARCASSSNAGKLLAMQVCYFQRWKSFRCKCQALRKARALETRNEWSIIHSALDTWRRCAKRRVVRRTQTACANLLSVAGLGAGRVGLCSAVLRKWHRFILQRRKWRHSNAVVDVFRKFFTIHQLRHSFSMWRKLVDCMHRKRIRDQLAEALQQRSSFATRCVVFTTWSYRAERAVTRRRIVDQCHRVFASTFAGGQRRQAFALWKEYARVSSIQRGERQRRLEMSLLSFMGATERGTLSFYYHQWRRVYTSQRAARVANEACPQYLGRLLIRGTSSVGLQQAYWKKWFRFASSRATKRRHTNAMRSFFRHTSLGLLAIYRQKWQQFVRLQQQRRYHRSVAKLIGRASDMQLHRFYWSRWRVFHHRRQRSRALHATVQRLRQRVGEALSRRYLHAWVKQVYSVSRHRRSHHVQLLNSTEHTLAALRRGTEEQRLLMHALAARSLQVEAENSATRRMIETTQAHRDQLANELSAMEARLHRTTSATVRVRSQRRQLGKSLKLRRHFFRESFSYEAHWDAVRQHLDALERIAVASIAADRSASPSAVRARKREQAAYDGSTVGGRRLDAVLLAAAAGGGQETRKSRSQFIPSSSSCSQESPVKIRHHINGGPPEQQDQSESDVDSDGNHIAPATAAVRRPTPVLAQGTRHQPPLARSERRQWLLKMVRELDQGTTDVRTRISDELFSRVRDDEKHMWNVEGIVYGANRSIMHT